MVDPDWPNQTGILPYHPNKALKLFIPALLRRNLPAHKLRNGFLSTPRSTK